MIPRGRKRKEEEEEEKKRKEEGEKRRKKNKGKEKERLHLNCTMVTVGNILFLVLLDARPESISSPARQLVGSSTLSATSILFYLSNGPDVNTSMYIDHIANPVGFRIQIKTLGVCFIPDTGIYIYPAFCLPPPLHHRQSSRNVQRSKAQATSSRSVRGPRSQLQVSPVSTPLLSPPPGKKSGDVWE